MSKLLYVGGGAALAVVGLYGFHRWRYPLNEGYKALPPNAILPAGSVLGRANLQVSPKGTIELRAPEAIKILKSLTDRSFTLPLKSVPGGQTIDHPFAPGGTSPTSTPEPGRLELPPDPGSEPTWPLVSRISGVVGGGVVPGTPTAASVIAKAAENGWSVYISLVGDHGPYTRPEVLFCGPDAPDPTQRLEYALLVHGDPAAAKKAVVLPTVTLPAPASSPALPPATAGYRTWRRWRQLPTHV